MATNSTAITKIKKRWERAEFWLEVASVVGGLMVGVGLWVEGEITIGQRLVIGGVAMEVICAWWVLVASRKLQNILEKELEGVRVATADANERAGDSVRVAAEANERAEETKKGLVEAQRNLEQERVERLKIEAQLAWRTINLPQEALIVRWMSQYKDAPCKSHSMIDVSAYGPDPEATHLAEKVLEAFRQSGCKVGRAQVGAFGIAPLGIVVEYQPAEKDSPPWKGNQWAIIAAGIVNTLEHAGLFVLPPEPFKYADPRTAHLDAPLRVTIGKR